MARKRQSKRTEKQAELGVKSDCTALYIRVSTAKQVDEGFSLEAQESKLRAFCEAHGWTVCEDHIYIDAGITGKTADRPEFQKMLAAAKAGDIERVVAIKLDRLARNTREFLNTVDLLNKVDCALALINEGFDTSTPNGKFALTMFAAIAELEVSTIRERTMTGKRQKASQGGYNGARVPLGYTYEAESRSFSVLQDEAEAVRNVFSMFNDGQSLNAIARNLNAQGAPTKRGGKWYPVTVDYILRNWFYAGLIQYDGEEVDGEHPPIVDRKVYEAAHSRLASLQRGRPYTMELVDMEQLKRR